MSSKKFCWNVSIELGPRCDDAFWFTKDDGGVIEMDSEQVEGPQNNFCIGFHQNRTLSVEACTRIEGYNKFKFYPYILLLSAFFLLLTVIVYTAYPKGGMTDGRKLLHSRS